MSTGAVLEVSKYDPLRGRPGVWSTEFGAGVEVMETGV